MGLRYDAVDVSHVRVFEVKRGDALASTHGQVTVHVFVSSGEVVQSQRGQRQLEQELEHVTD